ASETGEPNPGETGVSEPGRTYLRPPPDQGVLTDPATMTPATAHRAGFVSLIGRPNAGKSTLLNRLVREELSIVSPRPQTPRNRTTGIKNIREPQFIFVDTPGLFPAEGKLGNFMLNPARRAVEDVDVVCLVVDAAAGDGPDALVLEPIRAYAGPAFCI